MRLSLSQKNHRGKDLLGLPPPRWKQSRLPYLEDGPEWLDEVPAELFGELIERIIIISPERLKFRLLNGMELAENIERTVR